MTNHERTMKEVVAGLRERSADALAELHELDFAVHEMVTTAHRLAAALREIAGEAEQLAQAGSLAPKRLVCLRDYARLASVTAAGHAGAFSQLELGIKSWGLEDRAP
jgi:hypothetical protein